MNISYDRLTTDVQFFLDKYLLHFVKSHTSLGDFLPYAHIPLKLPGLLPIQKALINVYGIGYFAELNDMGHRCLEGL